ncbi:MAG: hypothetical protein ABIR96_02095 [Bdellovibrionota bacterium]
MQSISFQTELRPLETPKSATSVRVEGCTSGTRLQLRFVLRAEGLATQGLDAFAWEKDAAGFSETLWKKSCFEIFLADASTGRYWEWNFSPLGRWGAFSFRAPRERCPKEARRDAGLLSLSYDATKIYSGEVAVKAELDLAFSSLLGWGFATGALPVDALVSLNAITECTDGERVHWALKHSPNGKADFHTRENFVKLTSL